MKKIIALFSLTTIAFSTLLCTSCTKSSNSSSIVGNWEAKTEHYSGTSYLTTPPTPITFDSTYAHGKSTIVSLKSDKSYVVTDYTSTPSSVVDAGTYTTANGKLIINSTTNQSIDTTAYTLSGNSLVLTSTDTSPGQYSLTITATYARQ